MASTGRYHHGNLRAALLEAAFAAGAKGGPEALVVRDLARVVGVSPAAAYHHFQDRGHLVAVVSQRAREALAEHMAAARLAVPTRLPVKVRAVRRLAAVSLAYLDFAEREPELLRMAFAPCVAPVGRPDDPTAWGILVATLDEVEHTGAMDPARRSGAELVIWSALHGLSVLRGDGAFPPQISTDGVDAKVVDDLLAALGCSPGTGTVTRVRSPSTRRARPRTPGNAVVPASPSQPPRV
ncbi:MAG: TetR/AcrR family transcriptional regulator [Actinobacteria bacterium]|nr:TetR/AcrR family transcriptional regulator [Actinomycetota bacterium]MBI3688520.1 TetR/AcrR family transcriptional regulator [Actinomycetota bacterium]